MSNQKHSPKHTHSTKKNKVWVVLVAILLVIAAVLLATGIYFAQALRNPASLFTAAPTKATATQTPSAQPSPQSTQASAGTTPEPAPTEEPAPDYEFAQDRLNILVLGSDSSKERVEQGMNSRTDTMLLVSIDFANNDVDMISLPRDSYVRINGGDRRGKLNAAFVYGGGSKKDGYQYAQDTVSWALGGIRVDYYVGFGMQVVKDVVNAMGGIEYEVEFDFVMNGRETKAGLQHMDGQKVLDYCRFRKSGRGDIDRVDRQQRVLMALFSQLKTSGQIKNIPKIYEAVASQIETNLDLVQIAALAYWARNLDLGNIDRHTLPGYGMYIGGTSYWVLDQDKKKELVKDIFGVNITIPEGESYQEIKAQADKIDEGVNRLTQLMLPLNQGVLDGSITDPGIVSAVNQAHAALLTRKAEEISDAIDALLPYEHYTVPSQVTPTPQPSLGDPGEDPLLGGFTATPAPTGGLLGG